jgi:hypothetical protein
MTGQQSSGHMRPVLGPTQDGGRPTALTKLVRKFPGSTMRTRMLWGATSLAKDSEAASRAALEAAYSEQAANGSRAATLEMLMMVPDFASRMLGRAACIT